MPRSVSGHEVLAPGDPRLRTGTIPGTKRRLTLHKDALPVFLHCFASLSAEVRPLSWDTWSYAYRIARAASAWSDHAAGMAGDAWSGSIGSQASPTTMTAEQARRMGRVLARYRTADGRYAFGWGTRASNPGVSYPYTYQRLSDPMHVFVRPGVTPADLREAARRMGIRADGTTA